MTKTLAFVFAALGFCFFHTAEAKASSTLVHIQNCRCGHVDAAAVARPFAPPTPHAFLIPEIFNLAPARPDVRSTSVGFKKPKVRAFFFQAGLSPPASFVSEEANVI